MPKDKILLQGMEFYGYHGVLPEERALGQPFRVTAAVYLPLAAAGCRDSLEDTVNYALLYEDIREIMTGDPVKLLETLAEKVAAALLSHEEVEGVSVEVEKTKPPLPGLLDGVKVCIHREKR